MIANLLLRACSRVVPWSVGSGFRFSATPRQFTECKRHVNLLPCISHLQWYRTRMGLYWMRDVRTSTLSCRPPSLRIGHEIHNRERWTEVDRDVCTCACFTLQDSVSLDPFTVDIVQAFLRVSSRLE
jgi:hypothetical protein